MKHILLLMALCTHYFLYIRQQQFVTNSAPYYWFVSSEYLPKFAIAQLANPTLTTGYGHVGKVALVLYHLVNALFEGVLRDAAVQTGRTSGCAFILPIL